MVVTRSRLHAVRMKQAIDRYISEKGYDLRACVAFSGTVEVDGLRYTEPQLCGDLAVAYGGASPRKVLRALRIRDQLQNFGRQRQRRASG